MVGTNDLDKSEKFYNKLLDTVGLKKIYSDEGLCWLWTKNWS
jgi:hypothetical protein